MDFLQFQKDIDKLQSRKWTPRQKRLDALQRALYGELYDHLSYAFSQEYADRFVQKRLPLDERRASAPYRLPAMITREVTGMLFGEDHRPTVIVRDDDYTSTWIQAFFEDSGFWLTLLEAATIGSVGSVAIVLRVLGESETDEDGNAVPKGAGRYYWEVWPSKECSPIFDRVRPGELLSISRTYFVSSDSLAADGYDVDALARKWELPSDRNQRARSNVRGQSGDLWAVRIELNHATETWYEPVPKSVFEEDDFKATDWVVDDRSFAHGLGEVPARWIIPVRDRHTRFPDGMCFFEPAIDYQFRIDRTVSQTGRAFDYAGDPQLATSNAGSASGDFGEAEDDEIPGATASDVVEVSEKGGAWFLEIKGEGLSVAIDVYVKMLVRLAKEVAGASRITEESQAGTELSGVAMKLLNSSLIYLVGVLRISFGEQGLVPLLRLAMRIAQRVDVALPSLAARLKLAKVADGSEPDPAAFIELNWPPFYEPTGQDKLFEVQAITTAVEGGVVSQETAVANASQMFDVQDSGQELDTIKSEAAEKQQAALQMQREVAQIAPAPQPGARGSHREDERSYAP